MYVRDPIESDAFYNRLSSLVRQSWLSPSERILFLSSFESWYYFQNYDLYSSISQKAIQVFEEVLNERS